MPPEASRCDSCLTELTGAPKFCPECGTPVPVVGSRESRRTVTLLFTDVTGSTAMGEALDPEAYRALMGRYFAVAREAVEHHGGTVEKFVGDAVLAVFGLPEIREDDALRAVRAADELRHAMADLAAELLETHGVRLAIRTGVNTGPVVTGSARAGGAFATGDAVNTAARLEQHAAPGEVLIGLATYRLVRDAVDVQPVEPIVAKGKTDPVAAYRLLGVEAGTSGRTRQLDRPLVGRERESRALDDALASVEETGRSHLVTILGTAGLGKTRLVGDFLNRIGERATIAGGRCLSYGHGITFWPIVQAIRSAVGLGGGEPDEVIAKAVRDALDAGPGAPGDADDVVRLLLPLLGGAGAPGSNDQTSWAVGRLLEQLALRRPLVLNLDDLQWAEPALLKLVETVGEGVVDLPVLLLCQARPELLDDHPGWGRGSLNALTFVLEPFDTAQIASSVAALLVGGVPPTLVETVAEWTGGNPLFVEEVISHLREIGRLQETSEGWRVEDLGDVEIPPTVSALLAARLARLPEEERDLLERVSVIGLEFTASEAATLGRPDADVAGLLGSLSRHELLRRSRRTDGDLWSFRHLLIRDAAYESLPKGLRAQLHERFADALETEVSDAGPERLAFVAHHLEQAGRLRRELAPHDSGLAALDDRTAATLEAAAEAAVARDDVVAYRVLLRRAADLPLPSRTRRRLLVTSLHGYFGDNGSNVERTGVLQSFEALIDDSATEIDHLFLAAERADISLDASQSDANVDEAEELAERLLATATAAGDATAQLAAHRQLGMVAAMRSRWIALAEHADAVVAHAGSAAARGASLAYAAAYLHGPFPLSRLRDHTAARLSEPGHSDGFRASQLLMHAIALAGLGVPEWSTMCAQAVELFPTVQGGVLFRDVMRAEAHLYAGDPATAAEMDAAFVAEFGGAGHESYVGTYQAFRVCLLLEGGTSQAEVLPLLEEAEGWAQEYDVTSMTLIHTARAVLASRDGRHDEALAHTEQALDHAHRADALRHRADTRRWLHEVWHRAGDHTEERRQLELALGEYQQKEAVVLARKTEGMLAGLGCS